MARPVMYDEYGNVIYPDEPGTGGVVTTIPAPAAPPVATTPVATQTVATTPVATTVPTASPGTLPSQASFLDYYSWGGPQTPDLSWVRGAPAFEFQPQPDFSYAAYEAPTAEGMYADPGYQFRLEQGRKALEQGAAGRGTLRTGGTLKDLLGYGQNLASQEYGNVVGRALQAYQTNRANAADIYGTNYANRYQLAKDVYTPKLLSWQTEQAARQSAANQGFNRAWDVYSQSVPSATTLFNAGLT